MYQKKMKFVCSKEVKFDIEDGKLKNVEFFVPDNKGCKAGLSCFAKLIEGEKIERAIDVCKDIDCRNLGTSCYKQFAKALIQLGCK